MLEKASSVENSEYSGLPERNATHWLASAEAEVDRAKMALRNVAFPWT